MRRPRSLRFEALEQRVCLDGGAVPSAFRGSPITLPNGAWTQTPFFGSPIFADLKGDGKQELIVEAAGGKMIAYGTNADGTLVKFQEYDATPLPDGRQANFKSTPVVVNVPGVGKVVIGALGRDETALGSPTELWDGRVFAFNAVTGQVLAGWPQQTTYPPPGVGPDSGVTGALTIGYLEGNGRPDVIVNSTSTLVNVFRMDGSKLWSYENDETVEPGAVVADLYGDGRNEVILTSGMSPGQFYPAGGYLTILNGSDGSLVRRIHTDEAFFGSPVVTDLFGNGQKEIIAATSPYLDTYPGRTPAQQAFARAAGNRIYAFFPDGSPVPGWPYHTTTDDATNHQTWKEPIAADLFGNGRNEVIEIDRTGVLHVIGPGGKDIGGFNGGVQLNSSSPFVPNAGNDVFSTPIVADVNGDGHQEIIVSRADYIAVFNNAGRLLWSTTTPGVIASAAAYGQFDPNGPPVLAFVSSSNVAPGPPGLVTVFPLPASPVAPSWPMLRKDARGQAISFSTSAEAAFVTQAYQVLLGRTPGAGEVNYNVAALTSKQFSRIDLASKLAKSPEGIGRFPGLLNGSAADTTAKVSTLYRLIGSPSVPADSLAAILYDAHRGRKYVDAAILIVGANGNYAAAGEAASWASSVFRDVFDVPASPGTIANLVGQLDSGSSMGDVVKGLLTSPDARKGYVIKQVAQYLGRPANAADFGLMNYSRREDVVVAITAGNEFYARGGGTPTGFVNALFTAVIGFAPTPSTTNALASQISSGSLTRDALARTLVTGASGQLYFNNFVVASLFKYRPDPSKGDLRIRFGASGPIDNPDPGAVNTYTNLLVSGGGSDEIVLASMMTSPQYLAASSYLRGGYISPGVRA